jgi:Uma2 family endonuclease
MAQLVTSPKSGPSGVAPEPEAPAATLMAPLVLRLPDSLPMDDDQFFDFCQENELLRIERSAEGEIILMPPAGGESGNRNFWLTARFAAWVEQDGTGEGFDSSTGFRLPNGATRSPDVAWAKRERLTALAPRETERFIPLCPDFVVELRSPSDRLTTLKKKLREYIANGASLGWLLDPVSRRVFVYRPNRPVEELEDPATLSGDRELPGFTLDVQAIFQRRY